MRDFLQTHVLNEKYLNLKILNLRFNFFNKSQNVKDKKSRFILKRLFIQEIN
ncbi:hypothetical protein M987_01916 [Enterobacter soli ATCC BAA-2102]|nr:hypothetical protein M987_01916 [Enterobacter soli ATCC BAA-2102]